MCECKTRLPVWAPTSSEGADVRCLLLASRNILMQMTHLLPAV